MARGERLQRLIERRESNQYKAKYILITAIQLLQYSPENLYRGEMRSRTFEIVVK